MACQRWAGCRILETFPILVLILITSEVFSSNESDACQPEAVYPAKARTASWSAPPLAKVLNIGTALSLNFSSTYGGYGKQLAQAYKLWFDWLNEERGGLDIHGEKYYVKLHLIDDNSNKESVANITRYLLFGKKINLFLAPYGSTLTKAAAEVLNTTGAVMVAGSASSTSVFKDRPRLFGLLAPAFKNLGPFFEMLQSNIVSEVPVRTIAYLYQDQPFPRGVCGVVDSLAKEKRFSVVFGADQTGKFTDESDVAPLMKKIAASKADVLIGCVYGQLCKHILDHAKKLKYDPKAVLFTVCVTADNYREENGDTGGYVMGVAPWTRDVQTISSFTNMSVQEFVKMFEDRYRSRITYQAAAAFSTAATLTRGIIDAQTVNDTGKIAEAIRNLNLHSEFGLIAFDENGQGKNPYKVVQAKGDAMPVIAPPTVASSFPSYPKPSFDSLLCYNSNLLDLGRYGIAANGSCLRCSSIEVAPYQKELGYRVCEKKICPPGHHSLIFENIKSDKSNVSIIGAYCPKCFSGYYASTSGFTQCQACEVGKHQAAVGATACETCPAGRYSDNQASISCQKCNSGRYSSKEGSSRCLTCPEGSYCTQDSEASVVAYTNADGFFLFRDGDDPELPLLVPCMHGEDGSACVQGGTCYVDAETNEEAMEGPFCGACRDGYGRSSASDVCKKCSDTPMLVFLVFVQVFSIFFFAGAIFLLITWADLTKPKNLAAVILRQCMNYVGMSTVVFQVIELRFPISIGFVSDMAHFFRVAFGASSPLFVAHAGNCMASKFGSPYKVYIILGLIWVPLWVLFLSAAFYCYYRFQTLRFAKPPPKSKLVTLLVVNLFVIHPRTTQLSLVVFHCNYFEKPRLMMDTTVDCQSNDLFVWQGLGLLGFVLYSLGIPLFTFLLLRSHKNASHAKNSIHAKSTMRKLGFLYAGFESKHYYFECVFMLRKVLYQTVILIPPMTSSTPEHDRSIKCMSMLCLAVAYLAIHMWCEPYDNRSYFSLDRVEAASLWAILITLLVQSWTLISNEASLFKESSHDVLSDHNNNRDIREAIAAMLVFFVHARFCTLAVYLTLRPILASVTKWTIFDHGFVVIKENGLYLHAADSRGRRLFSGMFRELVDLLIENKKGCLNYEEFKFSLQYIGCNAAYHRAQDNYDLGLSIDDDEAVHTSVLTSFRDRDAMMNLLGRAWRTFNANVVTTVQKSIDQTTNIIDVLGGDDVRSRRNVETPNAKRQKERLQQMKHFNSDTVQSTYGRQFSIDELQLAMVRIQREVGKIKQKTAHGGMFGVVSSRAKKQIPDSKKYHHGHRHSHTGDGLTPRSMAVEDGGKHAQIKIPIRERLCRYSHPSPTGSRTPRMARRSEVSRATVDSTLYEDSSDEEDAPPPMSEVALMQTVLHGLKATLANLQERDILVGKQHKLETITHEIVLRQRVREYHEAHDFRFGGDNWYEQSSEEEKEETAKLEAGEHVDEVIPALEATTLIHKAKTKYLRAWQKELKNELFPPEPAEREQGYSSVTFEPEYRMKPENTFQPSKYIECLIDQECYQDLQMQDEMEAEKFIRPENLNSTPGMAAFFQEAILCSVCNVELEMDSNFCHNCGKARQSQVDSAGEELDSAGKEPLRGDTSEMSSHKVDAFMDFQKKQTMNEELKDLRFRTKLKVEAGESLLKEQNSELEKVRNQIARLQGVDSEKADTMKM